MYQYRTDFRSIKLVLSIRCTSRKRITINIELINSQTQIVKFLYFHYSVMSITCWECFESLIYRFDFKHFPTVALRCTTQHIYCTGRKNYDDLCVVWYDWIMRAFVVATTRKNINTTRVSSLCSRFPHTRNALQWWSNHGEHCACNIRTICIMHNNNMRGISHLCSRQSYAERNQVAAVLFYGPARISCSIWLKVINRFAMKIYIYAQHIYPWSTTVINMCKIRLYTLWRLIPCVRLCGFARAIHAAIVQQMILFRWIMWNQRNKILS